MQNDGYQRAMDQNRSLRAEIVTLRKGLVALGRFAKDSNDRALANECIRSANVIAEQHLPEPETIELELLYPSERKVSTLS